MLCAVTLALLAVCGGGLLIMLLRFGMFLRLFLDKPITKRAQNNSDNQSVEKCLS